MQRKLETTFGLAPLKREGKKPTFVVPRERKRETSTKDDIRDVLVANGIYYRMPPANGYGASGNFDFTCCVNGRFLGVEAKRDDKEMPTQLQTDNAQACIRSGGVALLIHKGNVEVLRQTIDALYRGDALVPSYWPEPKAPPPDHIPQPRLRRKEKP